MSARRYEFVNGNQLELLESGQAYFPALCAAIDQAESEIHLETYIFADDATGRRVADALIRAARRGVAVMLVVDGFGARDFTETLGPELMGAGVAARTFRPLYFTRYRRHRLQRLHRKLAVIDGCMAFIGGINVIDDLDTPGQTPPRFDYAVAVRGPVVDDLLQVCRELWRQLNWPRMKSLRLSLWPRPAPMSRLDPVQGEVKARLILRSNRYRRDIENAYLDALAAARQEIIIANAYFLPGMRFRKALIAAAQRGVRVILLLQGKVEYRLLHFASHALYGQLLAGGVSIVEYRHGFLHAKVAVCDGRWATVGSSNIDPFSLLLAREANLEVEDPAFAHTLKASLEQAMLEHGHAITQTDWRQRPRLYRLLNWLAYGVLRLVMGLTGYGQRWHSGEG